MGACLHKNMSKKMNLSECLDGRMGKCMYEQEHSGSSNETKSKKSMTVLVSVWV